MKQFVFLVLSALAAAFLSGCFATTTINPNYASANPELMRIGGDSPADMEPVILNLGSYCLRVSEQWKEDGRTPDGQKIWTRNSLRKVIPCR